MKPAVGYLRRSTTKQEQSLDGQRHAIEAFASRQDLRILRWYVDDGISGSTGEARPEFLRMVSDAQEMGDFQAVVAYDLSRFGRMDGDETGHYRYLLRRANVEILFSNETVAFDEIEASREEEFSDVGPQGGAARDEQADVAAGALVNLG